MSSNKKSKQENVPVRRKWSVASIRDFFAENAVRLFLIGFYGFPVVLLASPFVYVPCYRYSLQESQFTVDRRERVVTGSGDSVQSYYLVWSREGEVYCVTDTYSFMTFDSSDRYGKLAEGAKIKAKVAGWRIPYLSWYRNIVVIEEVTPDSK